MKKNSFLAVCGLVLTALLTAQATIAADDPAFSTIAPTTDILGPLDKILLKGTALVAGSDKGGLSDSTASAKILAYDIVTGNLLWSDVLDVAGAPDLFSDIEATGQIVCGVGVKGDDDGDGGANAFVRCYNHTSGAVLWSREFESPCGSSGNVFFPSVDFNLHPAIEILAGRVLVYFSSFCDSTSSSFRAAIIPLNLRDGTDVLP